MNWSVSAQASQAQARRRSGFRASSSTSRRMTEMADNAAATPISSPPGLDVTAFGNARDRGDDRQDDAKQHEPGRRVVVPRRQGFAQPAAGRLFAIRLHQ